MLKLIIILLDVAFKVGPETSYKYIVVNIHYLKKVENDASGLALQVSNKAYKFFIFCTFLIMF